MDNNEIIINAKNFVNKYGDINTSLLKEHGKEFGISKIITTYISIGIGLYHHHTI